MSQVANEDTETKAGQTGPHVICSETAEAFVTGSYGLDATPLHGEKDEPGTVETPRNPEPSTFPQPVGTKSEAPYMASSSGVYATALVYRKPIRLESESKRKLKVSKVSKKTSIRIAASSSDNTLHSGGDRLLEGLGATARKVGSCTDGPWRVTEVGEKVPEGRDGDLHCDAESSYGEELGAFQLVEVKGEPPDMECEPSDPLSASNSPVGLDQDFPRCDGEITAAAAQTDAASEDVSSRAAADGSSRGAATSSGRSKPKRDRSGRVREKDKQVPCPDCGESVRKPQLRFHIRTHTGERPFVCGECGRRFIRAGALRSHEKAIHLGVKPHKCKICGHAFQQAGTLKSHVATHARKTFYRCACCGVCFPCLEALQAHSEQPDKCSKALVKVRAARR